jgi:penicillin-binding protein 1A
VILENEASSKRVISKETASIMNIMLQNVVKNGTASTVSLKNENVSIAGKTGTSSDNKDKWFIGYTPDYACGVWVGYDTPRNMSYSKNPAIEYFNAIMSKLENSNESLFLSGDIVESQYCVDSGKLPSDSCFLDPRVNRVQTGYFIRGTEPKEACDIHKEVYEHLYKMNEKLVSSVYPKITPELMAIMSHDAYAEMIQMSQAGILGAYYDRLTRGAV